MAYEVQRLHHQKKINWYDMDGKLIRTGQYEDIEFESEGLRPEEVELAAKISSEIPTPFLRIDFMRAENGDLVFCEFTPCPENFEEFNASIDLMMGREFIKRGGEAERRLVDGKVVFSFPGDLHRRTSNDRGAPAPRGLTSEPRHGFCAIFKEAPDRTDMQTNLEGKVAIVTGVSGDGQVGQAVAKALAESGAQLAICAREQRNVEARGKELREAGARVLTVAASLTDEAQVRRLIDSTIGEYGRIDILVNLAGGLTRYKPAVEHTLDDWRAEVDNNLLSAFLTSRAAFPHLQAAGDGVIINFARAGQPQANMVAYNCAKAGVEALTRTLALEGRDLGIRVNAIAPGLVDTESNIAAMKPKDLKRWTKREDIAKAVVFLASPAAAGITGQVIGVTGWGL